MRKMYVIGNGINCYGYSNWLNITGRTNKIEEADFCLGLGGSDVSPQYYNQPDSGLLSCSPETDKIEYADFQKAIKLGKPIIGICKSSQWGAALAGGSIFQDINHPGRHELTTFDGKKIWCNSGHHNMQNVLDLKEGEDYKLLAWTENLSSYHINGYNENIKCPKEPEVVFYPKIKFLSFQNHNEGIYGNKNYQEMINWSQNLVNLFLSDKL